MLGGPNAASIAEAAFVKASVHRCSVVATLRDWPKTTGQVALASGLSVPHASRAIGELVDRGLAKCATPAIAARGRLYGLTGAGETLADELHWEGRRSLMTPMVRGTHAKAWFEAIASRFGHQRAEGLVSEVGLVQAVESPSQVWIPLRSQIRLLEEVERRFGDGSYDLIRKMAAEAAGHYPSLRRYVTRALPLRILLDLAPAVYLREFNHGRMEVDVSEGHAWFKHFDWLSSPARCAAWHGTYEGGLVLKNVEGTVRKSECLLRGDEFCGYIAEWKE